MTLTEAFRHSYQSLKKIETEFKSKLEEMEFGRFGVIPYTHNTYFIHFVETYKLIYSPLLRDCAVLLY